MTDDETSRSDDTGTASSLLRSAAAREVTAWNTLEGLYGPKVERWARRAGLQPHDAADIAQEVLWTVARKLPEFRHNGRRRAFRRWLLRITERKLLDFWRREKKAAAEVVGGSAHQLLLNTLPDAAAAAPSSPAALDSHDHATIQRVRAEFTDQQWQMFMQLEVHRREPADVAQEFGVSRNAVYLTRSRIKRRIRELREEED